MWPNFETSKWEALGSAWDRKALTAQLGLEEGEFPSKLKGTATGVPVPARRSPMGEKLRALPLHPSRLASTGTQGFKLLVIQPSSAVETLSESSRSTDR